MAIYFNAVGKIGRIKETEKFKEVETHIYESGWIKKTLTFNIVSKGNVGRMRIETGYFGDQQGEPDFSRMKVYGSDGPISYEKKNTEDAMQAAYNRFTVNINEKNIYAASNAIKAFENGNISVEDADKYNLHTREDAIALNKELKGNYKKYIFSYDFFNAMVKIVTSGKFANKLVRIGGSYEISYSENKHQFYKVFTPNRFELVSNDKVDTTEEYFELNFPFIYNNNVMTVNSDGTNTNYEFNGYVGYYDSNYKMEKKKGHEFCPITFVMHEEKQAKAFEKRILGSLEEADYYSVMVTCDYINGAEKKDITLEDLTAAQREDIDCELVTLDELKKQLGGKVYGEAVNEIRYKSYNVKNGISATSYTDEDMEEPKHVIPEETKEVIDNISSGTSDNDNIFDLDI